MILDEAIKRYTDNAEYERTHGNLQGCLDFKQLAEWFKELKKLREQEPVLDKIRAEIEASRWTDKDIRIERNALASGLDKALEIIDKYKTESEEE